MKKINQIWKFIRNDVPGWIQAIVALIAIAIGSYATFKSTQSPTGPSPERLLLQRIDFDYQDSPMQHGWKMLESNENDLIFKHTNDDFVGTAISINSSIRYKMEFEVSSVAQYGNFIEFVADLPSDSAVYAYVGLQRDDKSTGSGWLRFLPGKGSPEAYMDEADGTYAGEWVIYVNPISSQGSNWFLFQVDVEDIIANTFGKDGWHFQKLIKFRLKNNLSIDYISVFGKQP